MLPWTPRAFIQKAQVLRDGAFGTGPWFRSSDESGHQDPDWGWTAIVRGLISAT
jgi:hypothetical protein